MTANYNNGKPLDVPAARATNATTLADLLQRGAHLDELRTAMPNFQLPSWQGHYDAEFEERFGVSRRELRRQAREKERQARRAERRQRRRDLIRQIRRDWPLIRGEVLRLLSPDLAQIITAALVAHGRGEW
jgi:hypothetical protein